MQNFIAKMLRFLALIVVLFSFYVYSYRPLNVVIQNRRGFRQLVSPLSENTLQSGEHDLLVRALQGKNVERTPVWLMRQVIYQTIRNRFMVGFGLKYLVSQAGRYIADFRAYSEKYSFRERSETPDIAIELSLQPWRKFGVDGVIMFSGMCL